MLMVAMTTMLMTKNHNVDDFDHHGRYDDHADDDCW